MTLVEQFISTTIVGIIALSLTIVADIIIQIQLNKIDRQEMEDL